MYEVLLVCCAFGAPNRRVPKALLSIGMKDGWKRRASNYSRSLSPSKFRSFNFELHGNWGQVVRMSQARVELLISARSLARWQCDLQLQIWSEVVCILLGSTASSIAVLFLMQVVLWASCESLQQTTWIELHADDASASVAKQCPSYDLECIP